MERPFSADSMYTYSNGVLKNKFNIDNFDELDKKESEIINSMDVTLNEFNKDSFILLHLMLFGDLYDFAGKLRDENVTMHGVMMCQHGVIDLCLTDLFDMELTINDETISSILAYFYSELMVILPFRDGNLITIQLYLELWLKSLGYEVCFADIPVDELDEALVYSFYHDISKLTSIFKEKVKRVNS